MVCIDCLPETVEFASLLDCLQGLGEVLERQVFCLTEKMMPLDMFDMHSVVLVIFT